MHWEEGRQGTGYERLTFIRGDFLPIDLHLLRYRTGSSIPQHTDPVEFADHYRFNIILTEAEGGEFKCDNMIFETKRIKFFRPDRVGHSVSEVSKGTRYVLSIGVAIPQTS